MDELAVAAGVEAVSMDVELEEGMSRREEDRCVTVQTYLVQGDT